MHKEVTIEQRYELQQGRIRDILLKMFPGGETLFDTRFKPDAVAFEATDAKGDRVAYVPGGTAVHEIEAMTDDFIRETISGLT